MQEVSSCLGHGGSRRWQLNLVAEGDVFLPVDGKKSAQGGMVQLFPPDLHVHDGVGPTVSKAEVGFTRDIEQILRTLTEPLKVVHNVSPEDVLANFEKWVPAIEKELGAIDHAVRKISGKETGLNTWLSNGAFQRLPTKLVFTVKPVDAPDPSDPRTWYKRKARLVVCGNMAADSDEVTFSPTAAAELVRIALVVASQNKWQVCLLDVVAAFLKTPLQGPHAPRIAVQPPRVLQKAGMIPWGELWICRILTHALYGLRESPRLWSEYRDSLMAGLKFIVGDEEMYFVKGKIESSWWTIRDNQQRVLKGSWEWRWRSRREGISLCLNMATSRRFLRSHNIPDTRRDKVPLTKDTPVVLRSTA